MIFTNLEKSFRIRLMCIAQCADGVNICFSGEDENNLKRVRTMTTILENVVLNRLENLKSGHVAVMWDRLVVRVGSQFNVSDRDAASVSIRKTPYTIEQAEQILRTR